jgi:hypothetical protein
MYDKNSIAAKKYEDFANELLGIKKDNVNSHDENKKDIEKEDIAGSILIRKTGEIK